MEHTETLIVEQVKTGNEDAYQYIYDRHYALLCHVASGYVRDQFLAETIVGDTIFHLWEIRETLEISVSIRSYLLRAVRNRCIFYLKSEWKKRPAGEFLPAGRFALMLLHRVHCPRNAQISSISAALSYLW